MTTGMDTEERLPGPPRAPATVARLVGPALAYVVYIFVMGSLPGVGPSANANDKIAHFIAFGLMVPLLLRASRLVLGDERTVARLALSAAVSSAFGGLLELWQSLLPFRSAEFLDWVADTAGAATFALCTGLGLLLWGALRGAAPKRPVARGGR